MGGKSSSATVGYKYFMGLQGGLSHGPLDAVEEIRGGGSTLWSGEQTTSGSIVIDAPNAYGGDDREGGVAGTVDILMGEPTQTVNSYLASKLSGLLPAFRGLCTFVARGIQMGSNNPYPKPWSFRVRRAKKGWDGGAAWYEEKAEVPMLDGTVAMLGPGWEYKIETFSEPNNVWSDFTVPTSGWLQGGELPFNTNGMAGGTYWTPTRSNIWLRRMIQVNAAGITLNIGADNGCVVWIDGVNVGNSNATNAPISGNDANPVSYALNTTGLREVVVKAFAEVNVANEGGNVVSLSFTGTPLRGMNPAHIVYECLTNRDWGMGYPTTIIDDAAFTAAADQLYAEGFGLCLLWKRDDSIESFLQHIMDTVGAVLVQSRTTGLFQFNLIRGGYDIGELPVFDADNVQIESVDGGTITGATNELTVSWFDPLQKAKRTTTVQSLGNIQAQGVVVSATRDYPGIATQELAARVAQRDLRAATVPLKRVQLRVDRSAYALLPGGLFVLNFPDYEIDTMVFRVGEVDYGTLEQGYITVTAVQDVFTLPETTYIEVQTSDWTNPSTAPEAAPYSAAMEVDYRSLARGLSDADLATVPADVGYAAMVNSRPSGTSVNYQVWSRVDPADYVQRGSEDFCPNGTLVDALDRDTTAITLENGQDLDLVQLPCAALIKGEGDNPDEIVGVTALDATTGAATITRGCVDTMPGLHSAGARVWLFDDALGSDNVEYFDGEAVDMKALTVSGQGILDIADAPAITVDVVARQGRPYPPANVRINGGYFPDAVPLDNVEIAFSTRNRVTQDDQLLGWYEGDVTAEAGTTYEARCYLHDVLDDTVSGGASPLTWTPSAGGNGRVELVAIRDTIESLPAVLEFLVGGLDLTAVSIWNKLIDAWEMQETSGNLVGSKNGYVLAPSGGAYDATAINPALPRSFRITGDSQMVMTSPNSNLGIAGNVDVALTMWIKPISGSANFLAGWHASNETQSDNAQFALHMDGTNTVFWEYGAGTNYPIGNGTNPYADGTLRFIAASRNAAARHVDFWRDASSFLTRDYARTNDPDGGSTCYFHFGAQGPTSPAGTAKLASYAGLWIYNQPLTQAEVDWLYNAGAGRTYAQLRGAAGADDAGTLRITGYLPGGALSESYSKTLGTTGQSGSVTWSVAYGSLPDGLALNASTGAITGEPTTTGYTTFGIQAQDASGQKVVRLFTIGVGTISSLLHFNGSAGSTTFTDETGKVWTAAGNAQISTSAGKFGHAGAMDGAGDYISTPDSDDFYLDGDFTIEAFVRPNVAGGSSVYIPIYDQSASIAATNNRIMFNASAGFLTLYVQTTVTNYIVAQAAYNLPTGTDTHLAVTRQGDVYRLFAGGVLLAEVTQTNAMPNIGGSAYIGTEVNASAQRYLNGYISEFRLTKGAARYIDDFTPPAAASDYPA